LRYERLHEHFSHDHAQSGPQKFHAIATPRVGGIAIYAGLLAGLAMENVLHSSAQYNNNAYLYFVLASTPVFFGGIIEDVTKNVSVAHRLMFSMLSAALAIWLLGAIINRTDIPYLDDALVWVPIAMAFTGTQHQWRLQRHEHHRWLPWLVSRLRHDRACRHHRCCLPG
jgi:UDP-N-acetylmuramyl pentapeptide phosphotransferase/UDP-N-acetylglucosamine-1-phosphate transferase